MSTPSKALDKTQAKTPAKHQAPLPDKPGHFAYTAGLDIGNGYVKGVIEDRVAGSPRADVLDLPSVAATVAEANQVPDPASAAPAQTADADAWYNSLDVTFSTNLVGDRFRHLIGRSGLATKANVVEEFDLVGNRSKAEQELSKILVLGLLAGRAVRDYVAINGELPGPDSAADSLTVRATVALALPINEYANHRDSYRAGFLGTGGADGSAGATVHQVTVGNFETPVTVSVIFDDVMVLAEGMSAQYAINQHGEKLMERMLAEVRSRGARIDDEITAADLLSAKNTIGVDVGEGTVNFPVHSDGKSNVGASRTLARGYGTVLEMALDKLRSGTSTTTFSGRKQLAEFLQAPHNALTRKRQQAVELELESVMGIFAEQVAHELSRVLSDVGSMTEVIYVYGGGSGPMREALYPALLDKVREMNSLDLIPVLYLDSRYSRALNREGLVLAARNRARVRGWTE